MTQQEAADSVHVTLRAWQMWEAGQRKMPAAAWELYVIKAGIHPLYSSIQKI
jgi:DNA-binding transcriptional regulator YiaG